MTKPLDRDDDEYAELDQILDRHRILEIHGRCIIYSYLDEQRVHADQLMVDAAALGLDFKYHILKDGENPDKVTTRHRWTLRRVGLDDIFDCIACHPGIKFTDLIEVLYGKDLKSDLSRRKARGKLRVALFNLGSRVEKVFDADGTERWHVRGVNLGLAPTQVSANAGINALAPREWTDEELDAGVAVLRTYKIFTEVALERDPTMYRDLIRQVLDHMNRAHASLTGATSP